MVCNTDAYLEPEWEPWDDDLSEAVGVYGEARRRKQAASADLTAAILRTRRQGISVPAIARQVGVTRDAVYRRIRKAKAEANAGA